MSGKEECKKGFTYQDLFKRKCQRWVDEPLGCTHCPDFVWEKVQTSTPKVKNNE